MIHHNIDQNSEEWHKLRCGKFTASSFKDLFAKKDTATYRNAINSVVYQILTGDIEETYQNDDMRRGHEIEPLAADAYELETFSTVKVAGFWELNKFVGASPDRLVDDDGLLEIKAPKPTTMIEYLDDRKLPSVYFWQVHGQMLCTGRKWCDFMAYHPKLEPIIIRIERDELIIEQLTQKLYECIYEVEQKIKSIKKV